MTQAGSRFSDAAAKSAGNSGDSAACVVESPEKSSAQFAAELMGLYFLGLLLMYFVEALVQVPLAVMYVEPIIEYPYSFEDLRLVWKTYVNLEILEKTAGAAVTHVPLADLLTVTLYVSVFYFTVVVKYILPPFLVGVLAWTKSSGSLRGMKWGALGISTVSFFAFSILFMYSADRLRDAHFDYILFIKFAVLSMLPMLLIGFVTGAKSSGSIRAIGWRTMITSTAMMAGIVVLNYNAWWLIQHPFFN